MPSKERLAEAKTELLALEWPEPVVDEDGDLVHRLPGLLFFQGEWKGVFETDHHSVGGAIPMLLKTLENSTKKCGLGLWENVIVEPWMGFTEEQEAEVI